MPTFEKIKKRNGQLADFNPEKIVIAVEKSFKAIEGDTKTAEAKSVTDQVVRYLELEKNDIAPSVERVQDLVERALMERGFFDVAKGYIIYRYEHSVQREEKKEQLRTKIDEKRLMVTKRSGNLEAFDKDKLRRRLMHSVRNYDNAVNVDAIINQVEQEMYDEIPTRDVGEVVIMVVRSFIERDPAYSHVASRLLLDSI